MSTMTARRAAFAAANHLPTLDLNFLAGMLDPGVSFARAAGPATYFDAAGVMQTAGTNVARFDYDPVTRAPRGLLVEEARTNLLLNSAVLSTQSVTTTAAATTLSFYGTGSVALAGTFTGNLAGTGAFPQRVSLTFTPTAGALTCTVSGSVLNAQVETGAFATSAILSAGTAGVRALDAATMPLAAWFNPALGTLAAAYSIPTSANAIVSAYAVDLCDNSTSNRYALRAAAGGTQNAGFLTSSGGAATASGTLFTNVAGATETIAMRYAAGAQAGAGNGGAVQATASIIPAGTLTVLTIGATGGGAVNQINGYVRRVRYWPRVMSDAELQGATT